VGSEHQARILGMGLLLGEISFQTLAANWPSEAEGNAEPDLEALLDKLQRQGTLRSEALESLQAQVLDLERILTQGSDPGEDQPTAEVPEDTAPARTLREMAEVAPEDHRQTPSWLPLTDTQTGLPEGGELSHRLLSVLTLPRWNQFVNLQFIGEGGMGRIFKAFDPTLNRQVALKFLRWGSASAINNLVREARNQAQVDHPNICKVYEVKEWHGQVYVVMQFIEGKTLDQIAPLLEVHEKVDLMVVIAEAVHAAHRHGLIHRDLKPANIMVEQTPEGVLVPYVLDFGLARGTDQVHETREGTIQGTAHYMAPEQARGDTAQIERRTDVYALGATLYELFTGAPPFAEIPGLDCLRHILESEIPLPRTRNPGLASDLQTITMKCLEKQIPRRYESARALAEDLRRFRDGEPILALPASFGYRARKFAHKNKTLVALGSTAFVIVLGFAGLGLQARFTAASRAQWAQHFGQEAERIEALLRYARLQPVHDIRGELATVRRRIQTMEAAVQGAGAQAQGPGHYALGRAYLALGATTLAQTHLDQAWEVGFRGRDVAYSRGRALGQAYAEALDAARVIQDPQLRHTHIQELEENLRTPAIALFQQAQGSQLDPPGYQEGLLAFYDKRFEESLRLARAAHAQAPWFYEARRLEAKVHLEQARQEQQPDKILDFLGQADKALREAANIAPSDPNLWDLWSQRWLDEMRAKRLAGMPIREVHGHLQAACRVWKQLLVDAVGPEARLAWGGIELARSPALQQVALPEAILRAERLRTTHPDNLEVLGALAAGLQLRAYADLNRGRDPRGDLNRALALLQNPLNTEGTPFELYEPYVACLWAKVELERSLGQDPSRTVQTALTTLLELARRHPRVPDFQGFLGGIQVELADHQGCHGTDPGPTALRALAHLERAVRMAPTRFEFRFSQGNAHLAWAQYLVLQRLPAGVHLAAAEEAYRTALACNASTRGALLGLGEAGLLRARELDLAKQSPLPVIAHAEAVMGPLLGQTDDWRVQFFSAQVELLRAGWLPNPQAHLEAAEGAAKRAIRLGGPQSDALLLFAKIQMAWAKWIPSEAPVRLALARHTLRKITAKDATFEPALRLAASF